MKDLIDVMYGLGHGGSLEVTIFSLQSSEMCSNPDFSVQAVEKTKLEEGPFQNNVKSDKVQLFCTYLQKLNIAVKWTNKFNKSW